MKYSKEERLDIGHRIYDGEFTVHTAADQFGVSVYCARDYMRLYRDLNHLPGKTVSKGYKKAPTSTPLDLQDLQAMTKEELILEVAKARIAQVRLKKGYEVKGDGSVILYDSKNIK